MKEIYELKKEGLSLVQISKKLELKASESTISRRLREYCLENKLSYPKNKCGRKKIKLTIKN